MFNFCKYFYFESGQTYYITLHHWLLWGMLLGKYNSYEHAVFCITVYVHRRIYSIKIIALPFPEEAWQGNKVD